MKIFKIRTFHIVTLWLLWLALWFLLYIVSNTNSNTLFETLYIGMLWLLPILFLYSIVWLFLHSKTSAIIIFILPFFLIAGFNIWSSYNQKQCILEYEEAKEKSRARQVQCLSKLDIQSEITKCKNERPGNEWEVYCDADIVKAYACPTSQGWSDC